ncbi:FAD dependent oxidoreductase superfamily [Talaromyces proteolyticus]|uniref:Non-structural maintenance of chromosomes element 1 homolog n=1 Tax=Talaromyces proteolyticus TaxID=1131652 RepID=A0AAD4KFL1_9EURO|nr:FAD dependent oxidoreductase superfamily [Talaromyces proteolyticus]KAH8689871.1 FAD dependent oxidoreductase superfamily [Talaromyces proteolyticus]
MSTVIIGGGIIGASVAYYLSNDSAEKEQDVHVIESSSQLFSAASGYAAGFIAKDWFSPGVSPLGALSFGLHQKLAAENHGQRAWGYMQGTALSLDLDEREAGVRGKEWVSEGASRAEAVNKREHTVVEEGEAPAWLTGGRAEVISDEGVGQVDPLRLCQFLHDKTVSRGVTWHRPAQVVSLTINPSTQLIHKLFPSASIWPRISPLAGYSLLLRSPRHTQIHEQERYKGKSHAIFASSNPHLGGFSPEIFSRQGAEIYIAGLNSSDLALPTRAEGSKFLIDAQKINELKKVAVKLMGKLASGHSESSSEVVNDDDLQVLREGLCFRPLSKTGTPIVSRVKDEYLGANIKSDHSAVGRNIGGVFIASGHGPWGISLSLGTGKVVADLIDGVEPSADVSALSLYSIEEDGYNDSNRAFLQAFMARSSMTFEEAKPVLAAIFSAHEKREVLQEDITQADFNSYIATANSAISPFDLEIKATKRQTVINGESNGQTPSPFVYALVNTTSDPLTQLATMYTVDEIAFVKRLLDAMFETYNTRRCEAMVVSSMQAIQLAKVSSGDTSRRDSTDLPGTTQAGAAQSLSMSQAETVLSSLVDEGWLEKSAKGFFSLSPRGLMELRGWLVDTYNDEDEEGPQSRRVKFCAACKEILTVGQRCADRNCPGRLHDMCVRSFFRLQQSERCPVCKIEWPGDKYVGERALAANNQGRQQSRNTQMTNGTSQVDGSADQPNEDDAES